VEGLLGGAFDPPHNGHLALARGALERFALERLLVLVVAAPGHKPVETDVDHRLALARLAFADLPRTDVEVDPHAYTVDSVRQWASPEALFLIGADQLADFLSWRAPDEILRHVRLGVGTRPGSSQESLDLVLAKLERPDRVEFFEIPPVPVSSSEIRDYVRRGEPIDAFVPASVAREIERAGLYQAFDRRRKGKLG
jgi:nicotinate-nucleotide adenylyltransferase